VIRKSKYVNLTNSVQDRESKRAMNEKKKKQKIYCEDMKE
jgi:hypothetical protein